MNNRKKYSDRSYNSRWDEYADRDRYERDYYQNRVKRPQGYSYDSERDMTGDVDYHRYGTGYTGNNYDRMGNMDRSGQGFGNDQYGSSNYPVDSNHPGRTNYGYSENRNRMYGNRTENYGNNYGKAGRSYGNSQKDWNKAGSGNERSRGNYGFREPGYESHRSGSGDRNHNYGSQSNYSRGGSDYYLGRTGGDYENYAPYREEDRDWWDRTSDEVASWFGDDDAERRREMDRREDKYNERYQKNNHRGKGVKGYQRSDDKIKSDLEDELYHDSYIDASDMTLSVTNAVVTLTGSVDSKWTSRRAEDMAETITGVKDVKNNLTVRKEVGYKENTGNITTNTSHKTENVKSDYKSKKSSEV